MGQIKRLHAIEFVAGDGEKPRECCVSVWDQSCQFISSALWLKLYQVFAACYLGVFLFKHLLTVHSHTDQVLCTFALCIEMLNQLLADFTLQVACCNHGHPQKCSEWQWKHNWGGQGWGETKLFCKKLRKVKQKLRRIELNNVLNKWSSRISNSLLTLLYTDSVGLRRPSTLFYFLHYPTCKL